MNFLRRILPRTVPVTGLLLLSACGGGGGDSGPDEPVPPPPPPPAPVAISIADAAIDEGDSGNTDLVFAVTLDAAAAADISVDYATADDSATAGDDYTAASGTLVIAAGATASEVRVTVQGDTALEDDESLTLTLSNPSANASLAVATATGLIRTDDVATDPRIGSSLNDTGVTDCANGIANRQPCASAGNGTDEYPGQDAQFGRDVTANSSVDGRAGFSFTKLDANGSPLPDQSVAYADTPWQCVRDNVTGLTWEVKTADLGLHDANWTFSWYQPDAAGPSDPGERNLGQCDSAGGCDTSAFTARVITNQLCGFEDWRLPTRPELLSLVDYYTDTGAVLDPEFFPNTIAAPVWSGTSAFHGGWYVDLATGDSESDWPYEAYRARLVRGGL